MSSSTWKAGHPCKESPCSTYHPFTEGPIYGVITWGNTKSIRKAKRNTQSPRAIIGALLWTTVLPDSVEAGRASTSIWPLQSRILATSALKWWDWRIACTWGKSRLACELRVVAWHSATVLSSGWFSLSSQTKWLTSSSFTTELERGFQCKSTANRGFNLHAR